MVLKPMVRNNICINCHPEGCAAVVRRQIHYAKEKLGAERNAENRPRLALVIGCSTGYGLASRIAAAFGYGAATVGVSFEKAGSETKPGTPGFYNNIVFDNDAAKEGLVSVTINGDAYSDAVKAETIDAVKQAAEKAGVEPLVDLVVYSLASPVRTDPKSGVMHKSVVKPVGKTYSGKTIDLMTGKFLTASAEPATEEEIAATVKVMGGEDWELWMEALDKERLLSPQAITVAYTYIGPELSWPIYKNGTIGKAKEDLERAAKEITRRYGIGGAWVSVNKALVTRSSAVIPIIPFYVSCLFKVMKEKGLHEGCIEQMTRLYKDRLYSGGIQTDEEGRIRIDDWEMRDDVQDATKALMAEVTSENLWDKSDAAGFKRDFMQANGFDVPGVDYEADVNTEGV
jgi:enoyl-[acyl-carrier protein] reductase/trans-2-enoyl-CoA reductase (NAD+)